MRNIKFRAWNKEKNIMCYENEDNSSRYLDGWDASDIEVINQTLNSDFTKEIYDFMEFTGLKDKNGKEIYEGDILLAPVYFGSLKCVCIYQQENIVSSIQGFGLYSYDSYFQTYRTLVESDEWDDFEVIGNIYENPELLKD